MRCRRLSKLRFSSGSGGTAAGGISPAATNLCSWIAAGQRPAPYDFRLTAFRYPATCGGAVYSIGLYTPTRGAVLRRKNADHSSRVKGSALALVAHSAKSSPGAVLSAQWRKLDSSRSRAPGVLPGSCVAGGSRSFASRPVAVEPPPEGFRLRRPTYAVGLQQVNDLHHTISGLRHSDTLRLAAGLFTPAG